MVQVSRRRINGSIKLCRVHDLLRDLAMHEAKEEKFVAVFSNAQKFNQANRVTRRASLQFCSPHFIEYISPDTRSLLWFGKHSVKFSDFKLLKVLELVGVRTSTELWEFEVLNHLKYLGFRNCSFIKTKTGTIRGLRNLETLHIRGSEIKAENLWTISTLRHVLCDNVYGPSTTADLRNLQTLKWVFVNPMWHGRSVPRLDSLQELGLNLTSGDDDATICLLAKLPYLVSLSIHGSLSIPMKIVYPRVLPNYKNLQSLYLNGKWSVSVSLEARLFPPHLVKLTLIGSQLENDPMPELGKLESLKKLQLGNDSYTGDQMICLAGFPVLQHLQVQDYQCIELKIVEGVMPKLMYLEIPDGCNLLMPPELQHVVVNVM